MNRHALRLRDYLQHMSEAVERVAEYTAGMSKDEFLSTTLIQDAVMRNLGILGEAANNCFKVAPDITVRYPHVPFAKIYGLRNQLTHGYWLVDLEIVWNVVERDVPELKDRIAEVLATMEKPAG